MLRLSVLLLALAGLAGAQTDLDARLERAFAQIDPLLQASPLPGFVIGITDRDHTLKIFTHGFTDIKTKAPVTADSLFAIGSITKSFTAIALLQLADENRFDPAAPIT